MSIPMVSRWLWPVLLLLVSACSQDRLLTKQDYQQSQNDFMQGDTAEALFDFPRRIEKGDFITTMERGYLNLIQGKPDIKQMQQQADMLANRVRYHAQADGFSHLGHALRAGNNAQCFCDKSRIAAIQYP